jgi:hypothetical protein
MLLRYDGPTTMDATVEIAPDKFRSTPVVYTGIDLISGVTILSMASENDMSIDATAHGENELGAKTRLYINGVEEVIHTSC